MITAVSAILMAITIIRVNDNAIYNKLHCNFKTFKLQRQ